MEPAIKKAENKLEYLSSDKETLSIYWDRERSLHERANMINSAEERGFNKGVEQGIEKGIERGIEKGRTEGKVEMLIKLLLKRFKDLPSNYNEKIRSLSEETIEKILTDIFDIENIEDIEKYF
jgi:flagellar biosynthesis/type III secretory pathway protein FliH